MAGCFDQLQGLVKIGGFVVEIAGFQPFVDPCFVTFNGEHVEPGHGGSEWLSPTHPTEATGQNPAPPRITGKMLFSDGDKGFVGSLNDPLRTDVDPRSGGHLPVHHQPLPVELIESFPVCPVRNQIGIGNQDAGGIGMGFKYSNRLARLNQQGFIFFEPLENLDDFVVTLPIAGSSTDTAIDDQLFGTFCDLRIEIIHQHP